MSLIKRPKDKPNNPCFSSGPCAKRPGWNINNLKGVLSGRSHRSKPCLEKLQAVIKKSKSILKMPDDYILGIVPASDTGAIEMAMWSMLGARGVDALGWEVFGKIWIKDITEQLKLHDIRKFEAEFGSIVNLSEVDTDRDVIFTWNGTTSGVKVPNGDWIKSNRKGLTICDATSAVFAMDIPWEKLDVITWSWQKALGGEAAHGMIALSPRAVERIESYKPAWPIPKIFQLAKGGKLIKGIFEGKTINTPSMLAIEDCLDALNWAEDIGGLSSLIKRSEDNLKAVENWIEKTPWAEFLADRKDIRSNTSICFKITEPWFAVKDNDAQFKIIKETEKLLGDENIAFEIANHRNAPASYRLWCGSTIETADVESVLEWIDWAYQIVKLQKLEKAA